MSTSDPGFLTNTNLPSRDEIEAMCRQEGYHLRGIPLRKAPSGPIVAWVKYGATITEAEALTQDWVAKALDAEPAAPVRAPRVYDAWTIRTGYAAIGHIVMEYIVAPDCEESLSDVESVAEAVRWLIRVPAPNFVPGPVGGGPAVHPFFYEWASRITYHTVDELQDHLNGILKAEGDDRRVDFKTEASDGLCLCPCDINPGNFKKDRDGQMIALDFRATCFLPRSFLAFSMARPVNSFALNVARRVKYPPSDNVKAMAAASGYLVPYGKNTIGLPASVLQRMQQ